MNKLLLCTAAGAVPVGLAALPPTPFDLEREVAWVMPAECLIYAEAPGFTDLCEQGLQHPLLETVLASPLGNLVQREVGMPAPFALGMLNVWAGRPVLPTLAKLTEGGLAVGMLDSEGPWPTACVVARGDAEEWEEVIAFAMQRVAEEGGLPEERIVAPHRKIRGMDVWLLGEFGAMALRDGLFVGATNEAVLRRMIDLGAGEGSGSLGGREAFQQARTRYKSSDAFIWSWLDLEGLEAMAPGKLAEVRALPTQPAAQLLLGPSIANIASARAAAFEVRFGGRRIDLELTGIETPDMAATALLASAGELPTALPIAQPGEAGRAVLYRDLAGLFRDRVDLFDAKAQPGFAEATSNLALFFGGMDITDEVLPKLTPWVGLISRPVTFDEAAVPDIPLPGAALLLRTREPEVMGPQLVAAVQSLLSVINLEAAQNQQPVMTASMEMHEGVVVTYGRFRTPHAGEGVDLRYNLEPACAMVGEMFVLGTHRQLVKDLAGQLVRGEVDVPTGESLELSGPEIARVIEANAQALVLDAVVSEGKSEREARKELKGLSALAEMIETLRLETSRPAPFDLRASLSFQLGGAE